MTSPATASLWGVTAYKKHSQRNQQAPQYVTMMLRQLQQAFPLHGHTGSVAELFFLNGPNSLASCLPSAIALISCVHHDQGSKESKKSEVAALGNMDGVLLAPYRQQVIGNLLRHDRVLLVGRVAANELALPGRCSHDLTCGGDGGAVV